MADEKRKETVYADHQVAKTGKGYYRSKTIDLADLQEKVGRYASITVFMNERDGADGEKQLSTSLIFNESEAKFLPKRTAEGHGDTQQPQGQAPARTQVRRV